jgi:hypothetical protein
MPTLAAGAQYWLVLTPFDALTGIGWESGSSQTVPGATSRSSTGQGGWVPWGAPLDVQFQIDGVALPEPGTLTLFTTGIVGLLGYGWRRRKKVA